MGDVEVDLANFRGHQGPAMQCLDDYYVARIASTIKGCAKPQQHSLRNDASSQQLSKNFPAEDAGKQ
jgi:hypothetical protein